MTTPIVTETRRNGNPVCNPTPNEHAAPVTAPASPQTSGSTAQPIPESW